MAKIWLLALVALMAVTAIRSEEPAPAVPAAAPVQVAQAKIFVGRPIMRTGDVDRKAYEARQANKVAEENKKDEQPMVKIEPASKVEDAAPPAEDNDITAGETGEAVQGQLSPILPFFNGMSPFMQSIIGSMNGKADEPSQPFEDVAAPESDMPGRPRGVLTVVFMKAIRPAGDGASDEQSKESAFAEARSKISLFLSRFMPRRFSHMFGGDTDPDSQRMKLIGGDDVDRNFMQSRPLLGGDHDLDRFRPFVDESNSDSDSDEMNRGMMNPQIIMRTDSGNQQADLSDDMVRNYPPTNRCVMSFMRLKASAYYRTVVHLLFFSGIILLVLFMIILTIRVYRRRRALRFYNQNMHVATISYEDVPRKTGHGHNLFLFRLGSLRNSYAQKQAEAAAAGEQASEIKSSLLIQSPPAYDQVMVPESSKLGKDDDAQSVISLPAYHEVEKPKSSDL